MDTSEDKNILMNYKSGVIILLIINVHTKTYLYICEK